MRVICLGVPKAHALEILSSSFEDVERMARIELDKGWVWVPVLAGGGCLLARELVVDAREQDKGPPQITITVDQQLVRAARDPGNSSPT